MSEGSPSARGIYRLFKRDDVEEFTDLEDENNGNIEASETNIVLKSPSSTSAVVSFEIPEEDEEDEEATKKEEKEILDSLKKMASDDSDKHSYEQETKSKIARLRWRRAIEKVKAQNSSKRTVSSLWRRFSFSKKTETIKEEKRIEREAKKQEEVSKRKQLVRSKTEIYFEESEFRVDLGVNSHRRFAAAKKPRSKSMNDVTITDISSLRAKLQAKRRSAGGKIIPSVSRVSSSDYREN